MRKGVLSFIALAVLLTTVACSQNYCAKSMGGTMTVKLPAGQRLVTVTWKESNLWYLTRPRTDQEQPVTWTFKEKSDMGIQEGTVILEEQ